MTSSGPVPFIPWGTDRESRGEVTTIHNEKALTFHETLEVGVKDAGKPHQCGTNPFFTVTGDKNGSGSNE